MLRITHRDHDDTREEREAHVKRLLPVVKPLIYNGEVPSSLRAFVLLDAFDRPIPFGELRLLDFFLVFTEDLGGPASVHHAQSNRAWGYPVREVQIRAGLALLRSGRMISGDDDGLQVLPGRDREYAADPESCLDSPYFRDLKAAAAWLSVRSRDEGRAAFKDRMEATVARMTASQDPFGTPGTRRERMHALARGYRVDEERVWGAMDWSQKLGDVVREVSDPDRDADRRIEATFEALTDELRTVMSQAKGLARMIAETPDDGWDDAEEE